MKKTNIIIYDEVLDLINSKYGKCTNGIIKQLLKKAYYNFNYIDGYSLNDELELIEKNIRKGYYEIYVENRK